MITDLKLRPKDLAEMSVSYFRINFITFVKVIRSGKKCCDADHL
ncbi:hypothetical protein [Chryseobacterium gleum]|nr:hypothetical protein [Chryseobacterium gleum]